MEVGIPELDGFDFESRLTAVWPAPTVSRIVGVFVVVHRRFTLNEILHKREGLR